MACVYVGVFPGARGFLCNVCHDGNYEYRIGHDAACLQQRVNDAGRKLGP